MQSQSIETMNLKARTFSGSNWSLLCLSFSIHQMETSCAIKNVECMLVCVLYITS